MTIPLTPSREALSLCPFCKDGGRPYWSRSGKQSRIRCETCKAATNWASSDDHTLQRWNTRAPSASPMSAELIDRMYAVFVEELNLGRLTHDEPLPDCPACYKYALRGVLAALQEPSQQGESDA